MMKFLFLQRSYTEVYWVKEFLFGIQKVGNILGNKTEDSALLLVKLEAYDCTPYYELMDAKPGRQYINNEWMVFNFYLVHEPLKLLTEELFEKFQNAIFFKISNIPSMG